MGIPPKCSQETILRTKGIPLQKIVLKVRVSVKERLSRGLRHCRDAGTRLRYLMIFNVINGRSTRQTAAVLSRAYLTDLGFLYCSRVCAARDLALYRDWGNGIKAAIVE
jgi:hypothetical protein